MATPAFPPLMIRRSRCGMRPAEPERLTLRGHTSDVRGCGYSPDGRFIVSASNDNTLKAWSSSALAFYRDLKYDGGAIWAGTGCISSEQKDGPIKNVDPLYARNYWQLEPQCGPITVSMSSIADTLGLAGKAELAADWRPWRHGPGFCSEHEDKKCSRGQRPACLRPARSRSLSTVRWPGGMSSLSTGRRRKALSCSRAWLNWSTSMVPRRPPCRSTG